MLNHNFYQECFLSITNSIQTNLILFSVIFFPFNAYCANTVTVIIPNTVILICDVAYGNDYANTVCLTVIELYRSEGIVSVIQSNL